MPRKNKKEKIVESEQENINISEQENININTPEEKEKPEQVKIVESEQKTKNKNKNNKSKYQIGDIVYISKDADADLNGFKLFPQYKKYTYTVEAYDEISGVYSLRRLNLSLNLPESLIISPNERAHDSINRKQF